jgi:Flp pilus assembly protein TadD
MSQRVGLVLVDVCDSMTLWHWRAVAQEHAVSVITHDQCADRLEPYLEGSQISLTRLPYYEPTPDFLPGLDRVLGAFQTIVVLDRTTYAAYQVARARPKYSFRLIVMLQNLVAFPLDHLPQKAYMRSEVAKMTDEYWVPHPLYETSVLQLEGESPAKIRQVLPLEKEAYKGRRSDAAAALSLDQSKIYLGFFSALTWGTGILDLLNSWRFAVDKNEQVVRQLRLIIVGAGPLLNWVEKRIEQLQLEEWVYFVDPASPQAMQAYALCDVLFYLPLVAEQQFIENPVLLAQAMRDRKTLVAARSPLVDGWIGKHRIDFARASVASLAKALFKVTTMKRLVMDVVQKNADKVEQWPQHQGTVWALNDSVGAKKTDPSHILLAQDFSFTAASIRSQIHTKEYFTALQSIEDLSTKNILNAAQTAEIYTLMGDISTHLHDVKKAHECYNKALAQDAYQYDAYLGLGTVSLVEKNYDGAVFNFQKAMGLDPTDYKSYQGLGVAMKLKNQFADAIKWLQMAQTLQPSHEDIAKTLVLTAFELQRFSVAEEAARAFLEHRPFHADINVSLAASLFKQGRSQEALDIVQKVLRFDFHHREAKALQVEIMSQADNRGSVSVKDLRSVT